MVARKGFQRYNKRMDTLNDILENCATLVLSAAGIAIPVAFIWYTVICTAPLLK